MNKPVFVASGSYGCVIKPSYSCSKNHKEKLTKKEAKLMENTISKLFPKKKEWLKEIKLQEIVQTELDPDSKFTIRMIDNCELIPSRIKNTDKIDRCSLVHEKQSNNIYQIIYENGGIDLYNIIIKKSNYEITHKFNILNALHSFISILEGLKILAIKNYVHHDIKLDNILYDINKNKFTLIDFGFLVNINNTYNASAFLFKDPYNLTFKYFPPEYNIMFYAYINKTHLTEDELSDINLSIFLNSYLPLLKKVLGLSKLPSHYKKAFTKINEILDKYIYTDVNEIIKIFKDASEDKLSPTIEDIDKYLKELSNLNSVNQTDIRLKIDSYMLGLFLLLFITNSFIYLHEHNNIYKIPIKLFDLIIKMININPFTRIDIFDATEEYKNIFISLS